MGSCEADGAEEEKTAVAEPTPEPESEPPAQYEVVQALSAQEAETAQEKPGEAPTAAAEEGQEQPVGGKRKKDKKGKKEKEVEEGDEGGEKKPEKGKKRKDKKVKKETDPAVETEAAGRDEAVTAEGEVARKYTNGSDRTEREESKRSKERKKTREKHEQEEMGAAPEQPTAEPDGGETIEVVGKGKPRKGKGKGKKGKKSDESEEGMEGGEEERKGKKQARKEKAKSEKSLSRLAKAKSQKSVMSVGQEQDAEPHVAHSVKFRKSLKSKTRTTSEVNFDDEFSSSSDSYDEAEETETKKAKSGKEKKGKRKGKEKEHKRDDHHALEEGEVKPVEIAEKKEKGKKGTGKKGKKAKDEAPPPEEKTPKEVDIMAELQQMKMLAEGEEVPEVIAVEKKPKKKEKAKKKKPRVKVTAEMLEKMRIEQEAETARLALLERQRLEEERLSAIEKDKREVVEQQIRLEQLNKSACNVAKIIDHNMSLAEQEKELMEWELYIACGRLPNPSLCDQMNTYLHRWQLTINTTTVDDASQRTSDVVALLDSLQDLLDTAERENSVTIENYKWIRQLFRDQQQDSLDVATYRLLRNVEKNLHRIDIPTADYDFADENIKFSIWLRVILPIPLPNPRRPPKARLDINFENVNLQSLFPLLIECDGMAIRAMYLKYDHLSDLCSSFDTPAVPEEFTKSLLDVTKQEWRAKLKYKYDNRDIAPVVETVTDVQEDEAGESGKEPTAENETEDEKTDIEKTVEEIPLVPYKKLTPTASEFAISIEDEIYLEARKSYIRNIPEGALNLRKFSIIGGVFHLDLLYQPPQPQHFVTMDLNLTCLYIPKKLERVPFLVTFTPPKPTEPGVRKQPEEIEEEMKRQEEELDKLICITLTWPQHVIFLEPPIVCQWDPERKHWMKDNIHDVKPNEEKCIISFRTGSFGVIGLATIRYANLPYQAWELKPEDDGTVTLNITAAILMLEFKVKGGLICLSQLQNSPSNALQDLVGVYMKLFKLKRLMKEAGVDVFPEPDAFLYVEGSCEKHWPMERHLYFDMARMCSCFNFAWSRWNLTAGRRNVVMQMREYIPGSQKQKSHMMCLVTPLKATYINCTEVSTTFTDEDIENMKFCADLYNLMKSTSGIAIRKRVQAASFDIQYAVAQLLTLTRVLSFS